MKLIKHIPNLLTCLNLTSGFIAIIMAFQPRLLPFAPYFILIATFFDFTDGFTARLLKAYSDLGKQLDSLADMVSFGVAPGVIAFQMMQISLSPAAQFNIYAMAATYIIPAFIPIFSALRLAKFNIDDRQTTSFIGLPTPASAVLICSLTLILFNTESSWVQNFILNPGILTLVILADSFLMVSNLPMFSLKFKSVTFNDNKPQYIFIGIGVALLLCLKIIAIPMVILVFIVESIIIYAFSKKQETL